MPWLLIGLGALALGAALAHNTSSAQKPNSLHDQLLLVYLRVARHLGLKEPPPLVSDEDVPNARSNGWDISYNPRWLVDVLRRLEGNCRYAAIVYIWAHELAHHAKQDSRPQGMSQFEKEQQADWWAGVVLHREGISFADLRCTLGAIGTLCSSSHGCPSDRITAIRSGYLQDNFRVRA